LTKEQRVPIDGIGEVTAGSNYHWLQLIVGGFSTAQIAFCMQMTGLTTRVYPNTQQARHY